MNRWIEPAAATEMARKNAKRGQSKPCECGHEWGVHAFRKPCPCIVIGCVCDAFVDKAAPRG